MNKYTCAILGFLLAAASTAWAAGPILDVGNRGIVAYRNGRGAVNGMGLSISELIFGDENVRVLGGTFNFRTGALDGSKAMTAFYGPGGHFVIRGCVDTKAALNPRWCGQGDIKGTLVTGSFLSANLVQEKNGEMILIAQFVEHLNPELAALLDLPITSDGALDLTLAGAPGHPGWIIDPVEGGSLSLLLSEPSSIAMLGVSLLGLYAILAAVRVRKTGCESKRFQSGGSTLN
jgi:hypothetical protein